MPFTKEEYLTTETPFKQIYSIKNPFLSSQALEREAEQAKAVGVMNFKALYSEYTKSLKKSIVGADNRTDFFAQPIALNCGDWLCDDYGVRRGYGPSEDVACPIPVTITHIFENLDTGSERVELAYRSRSVWKTITIDRSQYASPRELVQLSNYGLPINLRMASSLSDYLTDLCALNEDEIPVTHSITRLGWIDKDKFFPYVSDISFDGDAAYSSLYDSIKSAGSYDVWRENAVSFRTESVAARAVLAASFASVLVKPLGLLPFFVHLWGIASSTGKTVSLMVAASVWANPEMGKYVKTFSGTDVGYERTAAFLNSFPLILDESQIEKSQNGSRPVKFDVYKLAEGSGKTRGNKKGTIDHVPTWANAILTTGETPLNADSAGAGAINRVVEFECSSAAKVVADGRTTLPPFLSNYGYAGRDFIEHLLLPGALESATKIYESNFDALMQGDTTDKQAMSGAAILTADALATAWIFKDGNALSPADISPRLASESSVSTGRRAYAYLCDWVAENANRMRVDNNNGDVYGDFDAGAEWAYIISARFNTALSDAGYDPRAVKTYLKENGLLRCRKDGKPTVAHRIGQSVPNCVCVKLSDGDQSEDYADQYTDDGDYL